MNVTLDHFTSQATIALNPASIERTHLVFAYGSLLKGLPNHPVMADAEGRFHGPGRTVDLGLMFSMGGYPGIIAGQDVVDAGLDVDGEDLTRIKGELYTVDDHGLRILDRLEGYPTFYNRSEVMVVTDDNKHAVQAWMYHLPAHWYGSHKMIINDGDWRNYYDRRY